jgi:methyltransferase OMS1, mitochondrial
VRRDWERSKQLALQLGPDADVSDRWDAIGRNYDDEIELAEKAMFMGRKRRRLVSQAKGEVLEVSVGTGRNMQYYDLSLWDNAGKKKREEERVAGLVFNDKAGVMVEAARKKFQVLEERKMPAQRFKGRVEFVVGDAGMEGVIGAPNGASGGFDTIVQTMGLCSTRDPVGFLKRLGELCRKPMAKGKVGGSGGAAEKVEGKVVEGKYGKEVIKNEEDYNGGRILLLEHGRGYYDWLNNVLDGLAPAHADHYGCWWNRDIAAIVEQSGLDVEYVKRYHLGTTWEIVLRPKREEEVVAAAEPGRKEDKSSGMFGWMLKAMNRVTEAISWR